MKGRAFPSRPLSAHNKSTNRCVSFGRYWFTHWVATTGGAGGGGGGGGGGGRGGGGRGGGGRGGGDQGGR